MVRIIGMNIDINKQIEDVKQKIEKLKFRLSVEEAVLARLKALGGKKQRASRKSTGPPRKGSLAACLQNVLKEANCALSVNQLVERVKRAGFVTTANVGLNNLIPSAMVRRPDIFVRVRHGVYDLKTRHEQIKQGE